MKTIIQIKSNGELNLLLNPPKNKNNCVWGQIKETEHNLIQINRTAKRITRTLYKSELYEQAEREFIQKAEELQERYNINKGDLIDIIKDQINE